MPPVAFSGVLVIAPVAGGCPGGDCAHPEAPRPRGVRVGVDPWGLRRQAAGQNDRPDRPGPPSPVPDQTGGHRLRLPRPIFFIATWIRFDAKALPGSPAGMTEIPLSLAALLVVRAVPALSYARLVGRRRGVVAGLMQATNLTFVIVATAP
jgi:hypothetical protein